MTNSTTEKTAAFLAKLTTRRDRARAELVVALEQAATDAKRLAADLSAGSHGASACTDHGAHVRTCASALQCAESELSGARDLAERLS
jgi:hypothetical protein